MPNHISVAHSRLDASNHLSITHDRTFNGKSLYYFEDGLVFEYLEGIERVLTEVLCQYPKLCVAHFIVRLPSDFDGDYSEVFSRFFRTLELETNELCLVKYRRRPHQYHQTVIRYVWSKACESTSQYHLVLFFDKRLYLCLGKSRFGRSRYLSRIRKAWDRAVETNYGRKCSGLAYSPSDDVYELLKGDDAFPLHLNEIFYRISRLAKPTTKHDDNRSTSFGCRHHAPLTLKNTARVIPMSFTYSEGLLMSNNTYLPNITHSKTFNDYPVFFSDKGLYESALTRMTEVLEQAMDEFDAALATRLDLFLPEDHQDTDLSIINDYFTLLKEKLDTDSVFYVWRKREDKVPSHNYRVMLFTDYNKHFGPAICWEKRNELVGHLKEAWQEAIEKHYSGKARSLVFLNDRGNYGLGTRCREQDTNIKRTVFHRMSSLAEAWKEQRYFFGSSSD